MKSALEKVKSQSYHMLYYNFVKYILHLKLLTYFIFYLLSFKIQYFASKPIINNTSPPITNPP